MNVAEIDREIESLEQSDTNWTNIQKLSWLYSVRDHLSGNSAPVSVPSIMPECSGEFGSIVSGVCIDKLMSVLSEHMAVIKVLHPKEYEAVLQRIRESNPSQ